MAAIITYCTNNMLIYLYTTDSLITVTLNITKIIKKFNKIIFDVFFHGEQIKAVM